MKKQFFKLKDLYLPYKKRESSQILLATRHFQSIK